MSERFPGRILQVALAAVVAACGNDLTLPPADIPIAEQQITVYALTGTPVNTPSAYSLLNLTEVRTDQTSDFDFAFEIGRADQLGVDTTSTDTIAVLLPRGALGLAPDGGFRATTTPFDSITIAPDGGYDRERPAPIVAGSVYFVTSRAQTCTFAVVSPRYAKLIVEDLDFVLRRAVIRLVIDPNCGYRELGSGLPNR